MVYDGGRQKWDDCPDVLAKKALILPMSEAVPVYEKLVSRFPTAAKYWKQYVEAYMAVNDDAATKQVFSRCLLNCFHVPLWQCYMRFIRKVNHNKGVEGQVETRQAFEFMLNCVGNDVWSAPLWFDYIDFLKSLPPSSAQSQHQEEPTSMIRKAYQSAVLIPTHQMQQLWKDYQTFEISVCPGRAKGILSELQPKHNSAKAVYRERNKYVDRIDWNMLPLLPSSTASSKEEQQHMAWKRLLAFDRGNPLRIDVASSNKRTAYAYEQCLMYLLYYPDIWYDYATWQAKAGSADAAAKVFQRALKALPDSQVLCYAYAEFEECRGEIQSAKRIYETILLGKGVNALAHVHFMRFLRRTEGFEAARKYFLGIRNSPHCAYHVYVAFATIAFSLHKDPKLAVNVFESGMERFMTQPQYILHYADFLCRLNDDRNARALYERALSSLPSQDSAEVWKSYAHFEQTHGDLASMLRVEQRMKEALSRTGEDGSSSSLEDVVSRYAFLDLCPFSSSNTSPMPSAYLPHTSGMVMGQNQVVAAPPQQSPRGPAAGSASGGLSGSNMSCSNPSESSRESQPGKRKHLDRHEDGEAATVQCRSVPRDFFRIRQMQKAQRVIATS